MKINMFFKSLLSVVAVFAITQFAFTTKANAQDASKPFGGLALYTVRDAMAKDARATLEKVAQAGYVNVESAGYNNGKFYNLSPADFKALLKEMNLTPISAHQGSVTLENADQQIADLKEAGFKYFVVPVPPMGTFAFDPATKKMGITCDSEDEEIIYYGAWAMNIIMLVLLILYYNPSISKFFQFLLERMRS